ncbi:MAG TPA: hypothetical protein VN684_09855, partial [Terriglobales bacterium]|nr:hypothetical protein [Terriglobales bacterium]
TNPAPEERHKIARHVSAGESRKMQDPRPSGAIANKDGTDSISTTRVGTDAPACPEQRRKGPSNEAKLHNSSSHPNSVIPTAADYRKAMICEVEGPYCVLSMKKM